MENQIPVKIVVINNDGHGMVRQWQDIIYGGRFHSIDLSASPDFVKLAEAYGAVGIRASKPNEVVPALEKAFAIPGRSWSTSWSTRTSSASRWCRPAEPTRTCSSSGPART